MKNRVDYCYYMLVIFFKGINVYEFVWNFCVIIICCFIYLQVKCFQYWLVLEIFMDCDSFILIIIDERYYVYYVICKLKMIYKKVKFLKFFKIMKQI